MEAMKDTWDYNLMDLLRQARLGEAAGLSAFVQRYAPFAVVSADYGLLLVLRQFDASAEPENRMVLNCQSKSIDFQYGITITAASAAGGSQTNAYLPSNRNYLGLAIRGSEIDILTRQGTVTTNVTELYRKLDLYLRFTEEAVETAFNRLCNEHYPPPKPVPAPPPTIQLATLGELPYNATYGWYEGSFEYQGAALSVSILPAPPKQLPKQLAFIDAQLASRFYEPMLRKMEGPLRKLKNDVWLGEDDHTGELEQPVTAEQFRERISISSITFYDDRSAAIYCNDDDLFAGHFIEISVSKTGKYLRATLAG